MKSWCSETEPAWIAAMRFHLSRQCGAPRCVSNVPFHIVRAVLAVLLLAAAGLKAHGLVLDPLSQDSPLASPRLEIGTIEVETILGLWLLSGLSLRAAWVAALVFFGILASASL